MHSAHCKLCVQWQRVVCAVVAMMMMVMVVVMAMACDDGAQVHLSNKLRKSAREENKLIGNHGNKVSVCERERKTNIWMIKLYL